MTLAPAFLVVGTHEEYVKHFGLTSSGIAEHATDPIDLMGWMQETVPMLIVLSWPEKETDTWKRYANWYAESHGYENVEMPRADSAKEAGGQV